MNNSNTKTAAMQPKTIDIHGKDYVPVDERVRLAHADGKLESITTEVLSHNPVVIKATVVVDKKTFTGISAANPKKLIEATSPYEVAETSAVGRALGFANYGLLDGIATAQEIDKALAHGGSEKPAGSLLSTGRAGSNQPNGQPLTNDSASPIPSRQCVHCKVPVNQKVFDYSNREFGHTCCYKCQNQHMLKAETADPHAGDDFGLEFEGEPAYSE